MATMTERQYRQNYAAEVARDNGPWDRDDAEWVAFVGEYAADDPNAPHVEMCAACGVGTVATRGALCDTCITEDAAGYLSNAESALTDARTGAALEDAQGAELKALAEECAALESQVMALRRKVERLIPSKH